MHCEIKKWRIERYRKDTADIVEMIKHGKSPSFLQRSILSLLLILTACRIVDASGRQSTTYTTHPFPKSV